MNAKTQTEVASVFAVLSAVDCSEHVEHKGKFAYLSWPYAVAELLKRYPAATWRVIETPEGLPYWQSAAGAFVKCAVTVEGIERVQIHPVLNGNNKTIANPNAFEVNTSIQRGLVKAIGLHGLGLYIYAGEDLPAAAKEERGAENEISEAEAEAHFADLKAMIETVKSFAELQEIWTQMDKPAQHYLREAKDAAKARLSA